MAVRTRLARLERILPPPRPPTPEELQRERRWKKIKNRMCLLLREADKLLTEAEKEQLTAIDKACQDDSSFPLDDWMRDLQLGRSRMPDLTPSVIKTLMFSWFHPDVDTFSSVCNQCGLQYPRLKTPPTRAWKMLPGNAPDVDLPPLFDFPEIFKACPHCGASTRDVTYSHLTEGVDLPWKKLDGWMGYREEER
jgi:hypothetical protein